MPERLTWKDSLHWGERKIPSGARTVPDSPGATNSAETYVGRARRRKDLAKTPLALETGATRSQPLGCETSLPVTVARRAVGRPPGGVEQNVLQGPRYGDRCCCPSRVEYPHERFLQAKHPAGYRPSAGCLLADAVRTEWPAWANESTSHLTSGTS